MQTPGHNSQHQFALRSHIFRAITGVGALKLYQLAIGLLASIILARTLGAQGYGTYSFVMSLAALLSLVGYIGIPPYLVREIAAHESRHLATEINAITKWTQRVSVVTAVLITAAVASVCLWKTSWESDDKWFMLLTISPAIPLLALLNVKKAILQGLRKIIFSNIPDLVTRPTVFVASIIGLWSFGALTVFSALSAQLIAVTTALAIAVFLVKTVKPKKDNEPDRGIDKAQWARSVLPFSAIGIVSYINMEMFIPLLGTLANEKEVAYFRVALSLGLLISLPLTVIESVIHPYVSRLYRLSEQKKMKTLVFWSGIAALCISLPAVIAVAFWGRDIIDLVFGSEYSGAYRPLLILATAFGFVNLVGPSMLLLHATEYEQDALFISVVSAIGVILLSLWLIPVYGAYGAAIALGLGKACRAACFSGWARVKLKRGPRPEEN